MRRLLELEDPPTAVFTVNNLVALGAIEAVRAAGLEVPDDVALVCFDDIEYASRLYPFLTVMEQPAEAFGTLGTQLLLDRIAGRGPQRPGVVVLPASSSCGSRAAARDGGRRMTAYGGIEAGGSKWECAVGTGPDDLRAIGDGSDDHPRGDDRPRGRLLRARRPGRGDRARFVRPRRPEAVVADLGTHHDDAEAGLGAHGRRPGDPPAALRAGRLRHRRQRSRARRAALGRRPGARHVLLHHGRDRDRRRRDGRREAPARARPSRVRPHAHPTRPRRGPVPGRLPVPRRLLGRARVGPRGRGALGTAAPRSSPTTRSGSSRRGTSRSVSSA